MIQWIPNTLTLLNLLCGCIATMYAFNDQLMIAGIFVGLGVFFDFFDGFAARALKLTGELGKQLDSLADLITSGLVPGIVMYQLFSDALHVDLFHHKLNFTATATHYWITHPYICTLGFAITAASAYRLAKFNIDTRQTDSFIGLPTPANTLLIVSLGIIAQTTSIHWLYELLNNPYVLIAITFLSCFLLNAELPLFALKFKKFSWKGNQLRWTFLLASIALIIGLQLYAIPIIIGIYILISLTELLIKKN